MQLDLNDVMIFTRVAELESFSGAARDLGMPKSSVSRRVSRLEDTMGVQLLQRSTRQLAVTDAGHLLYEHGTRMLAEMSDAEAAVQLMRSEPRGVLKVTASVGMGPAMTPLVAAFLDRYKEVSVELDLTNRYVDLIAEGYDAAIRAARELKAADLMARKLARTRTLIVATPEFLERNGTPQTLEDLSDARCLLFPKLNKRNTWDVKGENGIVKIPVHGSYAVNNLDAVRQGVLAGMGIGRIPEGYCLEDLKAGRMVELFPESSVNEGYVWVVYPGRRNISPKIRAWVDFMVECSGTTF